MIETMTGRRRSEELGVTVPVSIQVPPEIEEEARERAENCEYSFERVLHDYVEFDVEWEIGD